MLSRQVSSTSAAHPLPSTLLPKMDSYHGQNFGLIYEGNSYERIRAGEVPFILVPGIPSTERDFRHLAPFINEWAPVVRVVWPGFSILHEELDPPSNTFERAKYLSMVADAEAWGAHIIVGHSLGGVASIAHAARDVRVIGLYLISSVGVRRHRGMVVGPRGAYLHLILLKIPFIRNLLRSLYAHLMTQAGFKGHPFDLKQMRLIFRHVRDLSFEENKRYIEKLSTRSLLPVGIVTTTDDPIIDRQASQALVQALSVSSPHRSHLHLQRGGHNPQRHCTIEIDRWLRARYSEALAWLDLHPISSKTLDIEPKDPPSLIPEESP